MAKLGLTELINKILETAKIEEVVGDYVDLERKGNNFVGLCPFHSDSHPSMSVSPNKKIFKCFSCGAGGNVITFVQNHEGITFIDAVKKLADKYSIDWTEYLDAKKAKPVPESVKITWKVNHEASLFYKYNLENELLDTNSKVAQYINTRGIDKEDINTYQLGYAKPGASLVNFLIKKGFSELELLKAGVAKQTDNGIQDYFYDRLLFAIHDAQGNIIGFSGRQLSDDKTYAKYLNTSETEVFQKGKFLYNFHRARSPISLSKKLYIVEGYMDVISLGKKEINNVVATMGTAFTEIQSKIVSKVTNEVILAMDSDTAGINATLAIGKSLLAEGVKNIFVFKNTKTKDTDELVKLLGDKDKIVKEIESNLTPFVDFYRDLVLIPERPNFEVIEKFVKLLTNLPEPEATYHINIIAEKYNINPDSYYEMYKNEKDELVVTPQKLNDFVEKVDAPEVPYAEDYKEQESIKRKDDLLLKQLEADEAQLINLAKVNPVLFRHMELGGYQIHTDKIKAIYWALKKYYAIKEHTSLSVNSVMNLLPADYADKEFALALLKLPVNNPIEQITVRIDDYVNKCKQLYARYKQKDMVIKIKKSKSKDEKVNLSSLLRKIKKH